MDGYLDHLDATARLHASRCTRCGKCVEACPTAALAGLDRGHAGEIVAGLMQLTAGGSSEETERWVNGCNGSGQCSAVCPEGINVRQWVAIERLRLRHDRVAVDDRIAAGRRRFRTMSHSVRLLSSMQVPSEALARVTATHHDRTADFVFYTGCNVLRTPHLVFNVMDILDALGLDYEVMGGPSHCCGVYQFHEGDVDTYVRIAGHTYDAFAKAKPKRVLSWCPSCTKQLGESWHDYAQPSFEFGHIARFLTEEIERMRPLFVADLPRRRIAIHGHEGIVGVAESVHALMAALPNVEIVAITQDSGFGNVCGGPAARYPERERELHRQVAENAAAAGVDTLVTIYHACHRQLSGAEARYPFEVYDRLFFICQMRLHTL